MTTQRVQRNAKTLQALTRLDNAAQHAIVSVAKKDLLFALTDCARAILNRVVPLSEAQLRAIKRLAEQVRRLVSRKTPLEERRAVLQTGGLVGAIVRPVLSLLPSLLGAVFRPKQHRRRR